MTVPVTTNNEKVSALQYCGLTPVLRSHNWVVPSSPQLSLIRKP